MSANQSNLSDVHYGYDFVIATSQASINATMQEYLYNTQFALVQMYWNQDASGNPVVVSREDLLKQTNGTDPLKVATWKAGDPATPDITNISNSNFYFGFEAAIGIPATMAPGSIPDIVVLQEASQSVFYTMMCAQFTVVSCNFGRHGLISLENDAQSDNAPWEFTSTIPLKKLVSNNDLPDVVQARLGALGPDAFSVQQLLLDLDNAILNTFPTIVGVKPGTMVYNLLSQVFLGAYFDEMKKSKMPVLGYTIMKNTQTADPSTLTLTNMVLEVSPFQPVTGPTSDLNTLNYLCAVDGDGLPAAAPFGWNWLETGDEANFDGVIAIKRIEFLNYLNTTCSPDLADLNIVPSVSMTHSGETMYSTWSFTKPGGAGQAFTVQPIGQAQVDGFTPILAYALNNNSSDDTHDALHTLKMNGTFNYSVTVNIGVSGNTIRMKTHIVVYLNFWYGGYDGGQLASFDGNVIDYTNTVDYTMSVAGGAMVVREETSTVQDNSQRLNDSGWDQFIVGGMVDCMNDITNYLKPVAQSSMTAFASDIASSLNGYRGWVFPGGKTFSFKDVSFSDYQDFVSRITYVQP